LSEFLTVICKFIRDSTAILFDKTQIGVSEVWF